MKKISVIGATGSIGKSTFEVIQNASKDEYEIVALTGGKNVDELVKQAKALKPQVVALQDESKFKELKEKLNGQKIEILCGDKGVETAAGIEADVSVLAIVGEAGLKPALCAVKNGKTLALANKETLVCAGELFLKEVAKYNATLLPVDSEHSAIFQSLEARNHKEIDRIILTASGGPFKDKSTDELKSVTVKDALAHPNWSMGAKISIDSATMMNKGLEIIEAYHLFNVPIQKIEVVIHPESILHSGVAYNDGALIAELGTPDMKTPISYALNYPSRASAPVKPLDLTALSGLHFFKPDYDKFKTLNLAKDALKAGGTAPCILNAVNEIAVYAFLDGKIKFLDIFDIVKKMLETIPHSELKCLDDVFRADMMSRSLTKEFIQSEYL